MDTIILQKDTKIYRSYNNESGRNGNWFALNPNESQGQGTKTAEFQLTKDYKLINIISPTFYNELKKIIVDVTNKDISLKNRQHTLLFPVGCDDKYFQREFVKLLGLDINQYPLNPTVHTDSELYFHNRSRISIGEFDNAMIDLLKKALSSQQDGIISNKYFPDIIRNAYQLPELCVFDNSNIKYLGDYQRPIFGGSVFMNHENIPICLPIRNVSPIAKQMAKETREAISQLDPKIFENYRLTCPITNYRYIDGKLIKDPPQSNFDGSDLTGLPKATPKKRFRKTRKNSRHN